MIGKIAPPNAFGVINEDNRIIQNTPASKKTLKAESIATALWYRYWRMKYSTDAIVSNF